MNIVEVIKNKIKEKDRKDIVFIHPVIANNEIAKYISAFSNGNGGIILFGIKDDGKNLWLKQSVFKITEKEKTLRKMVDSHAKIIFGELYEGADHKLEYIYIEKSEEEVCFNGSAYYISSSNNKPEIIETRKVFLSYCQKDTDIANIVESMLKKRLSTLEISRDIRDVKYKESFSEFMQSIGTHDFVISIISDQYLKSRNCMYEIVETMRDRNFINKLFYVIISKNDEKFYKDKTNSSGGADIYSIAGQTTYIKYWKAEEEKLRQMISELENPLLITNHADELKVITKIEMDIQDFMKILRDRKGIALSEMIDTEFMDIVSCIQRSQYISTDA